MKTAAIAASLAALALCGCRLPGRPGSEPEVPRPEAVLSFDRLYSENCAGCHGANGRDGAATNLSNPEYQALIDDATLRDIVAHGMKGTLMPAFSLQNGGPLTDAQVDALVHCMRDRWRTPNVFGADTPPPYRAEHSGDPARGQAVYVAACAQCHGASRQQPGKYGSILDGSFLALMDEQTIRTTIIAGRPDVGQPDWRNHIQGHPLSDDEITNVTAWLMEQRPALPGRPYPDSSPTSEKPGEAQPHPATK